MAKRNFLQTGRNVIRTRFTKKLSRVAEEAFREVLAQAKQEFREHEITRELADHSYPSKILRDNGWQRTGTLFGFMGFSSGRDPIAELEQLIFNNDKSGFRFELNKNFLSRVVIGILGRLRSPTPEDFRRVRIILDGWGDGRAWPEVLEDSGIENLSYFFAKHDLGRSEEGFQSKVELNPGTRLKRMSYLSPIFRRAERNFKKLLSKKARER